VVHFRSDGFKGIFPCFFSIEWCPDQIHHREVGEPGFSDEGGNRSPSSSTEDVALEELSTLLKSEETTNTQLKNKISEIRNAREKSRQDLVKARKELRELLTLKQEATLISLGLLE